MERARKPGVTAMEPGWRVGRAGLTGLSRGMAPGPFGIPGIRGPRRSAGEMAGQEGQGRRFLRGEERSVVTARAEGDDGPGGQDPGERLNARVEGVAVAGGDTDRAAAKPGGVRADVAGH